MLRLDVTVLSRIRNGPVPHEGRGQYDRPATAVGTTEHCVSSARTAVVSATAASPQPMPGGHSPAWSIDWVDSFQV